MSDPTRCCADVWSREGWGGRRQCNRKGIIERDGKLYCHQHEPEAETKRRKLSQLQYNLDNIKYHRRSVDQDARNVLINLVNSGYLFEASALEWREKWKAVEEKEARLKAEIAELEAKR